ncbi:putative lysophosphatidic acid:oleoyl-CoA acyltransferase [Schizosaccharomyces pombe]
MEKFTRWRDPGTGIAPFHPINTETPSGFNFKWILIVVVMILRVPLCIISVTLWFLWSCFLKPILSIQPKLSFFIDSSLSRLLLLCFGCLKLSKSTSGSFVQGDSLQPGDILAVNHSSPLDVLVLSCLYNCTFAVCDSKTSNVSIISAQAYFWSCFFSPSKLKITDAKPLAKVAAKASKIGTVVILFPEGVCTNGRALCQFTPCFDSAKETDRIFPLYIKYLPPCVTLPVPSLLSFARSVLLTVSFEIRIRFSAEPLIPRNCTDVTESAQEVLSKLGRSRVVKFGKSDKLSYLDARSKKHV